MMSYAKENGYFLIIDLMSIANQQYLEKNEEGRVNAWEKFFMQPDGYSLEDIRYCKNIYIISITSNIKTKLPLSLNFLKAKPEIDKVVDKYKRFIMKYKKVLGVVYRGTDYINRKPYAHQIQPDLMTLLDTVETKLIEWNMSIGSEKIFLATEVEDAIEAFEERFPGKIINYPQNRVPAVYDEYLASYKFYSENDAYKRGLDYWIVLNILAECDSLIGGKNGATNVAVMLNEGKYTNILLFDLGLYGIDDRRW